MVSLADIYKVVVATVPLYAAMLLAYGSLRWWKIFTKEQCSGINKFVSKISVPLLSFRVISSSNPYQMNVKLILADALQKVVAILIFALLDKRISGGRLDWLITGFSVSTLPNTLIVGIPLIQGMYGDENVKLVGQIVVLQSIIWYTLLLFLFEFRAAMESVGAQATENTEGQGSIEEQAIDGEQGVQVAVSKKKKRSSLILLMVWKKLMTNPNTYASFGGLAWALISFRWEIHLPKIVGNSISIMADGGLGMAMFSIGLFMASQSKIIACGARLLFSSMIIRFLLGPGLMALFSYAIGMRSTLLNVAIVQAALPQGIVPFVFAKEYDLHPDILSTSVILGMLVAVPISLGYYFLLGL